MIFSWVLKKVKKSTFTTIPRNNDIINNLEISSVDLIAVETTNRKPKAAKISNDFNSICSLYTNKYMSISVDCQEVILNCYIFFNDLEFYSTETTQKKICFRYLL